MKLTVNLFDGRTLVFEGTYDELVKVGEECVSRFGNMIIGPAETAEIQPRQISQIKAGHGDRCWTEQSARRLSRMLYGEQAKVVKFLLQRGGKAKYADIGKHLGYEAQRLSGVLSSITRNSQSATGDRLARLVDWRIPEDGMREYFIEPDALPLFLQIMKHET